MFSRDSDDLCCLVLLELDLASDCLAVAELQHCQNNLVLDLRFGSPCGTWLRRASGGLSPGWEPGSQRPLVLLIQLAFVVLLELVLFGQVVETIVRHKFSVPRAECED